MKIDQQRDKSIKKMLLLSFIVLTSVSSLAFIGSANRLYGNVAEATGENLSFKGKKCVALITNNHASEKIIDITINIEGKTFSESSLETDHVVFDRNTNIPVKYSTREDITKKKKTSIVVYKIYDVTLVIIIAYQTNLPDSEPIYTTTCLFKH